MHSEGHEKTILSQIVSESASERQISNYFKDLSNFIACQEMTALVATRLDVDQGPFLVPFLVPRCRSIKPNAQYRESERLLSLKRDVDSCGKEVEAKNVSGQMRRPKQHRFKEVQTETLNQKLSKSVGKYVRDFKGFRDCPSAKLSSDSPKSQQTDRGMKWMWGLSVQFCGCDKPPQAADVLKLKKLAASARRGQT